MDLRFWKKAKGHSRARVPTVLQMEAVECGAASLAMILAYYGKWIPLEKLRQECGVTRDGSNADNILKAARRLGCTAKGFGGRPQVLRQKEYPLILFWEFTHFLVLEGIDGDTVYLNDPSVGKRTVTWDEFLNSYTGVYLSIRPGDGFRKEGHRYSVVKALADKLVKDKWATLFVILLGLLMVLPGIAVPVLDQVFLDDIFSKKHIDWSTDFMAAMVIAALLTGVLATVRGMVLRSWQKKLTLSDSSAFFWHVLKLPVQFYQQRLAGDIASRIQMNELCAETISNQAATCLLDALIAVFYFGLLLQYSVPLALIGLGVSAANMGIFLYIRRRMTDMTMRMGQDESKALGTLMGGILIIESIKSCGSESDLFAKWAGYRAKTLMAMQESEVWSLKMKFLPLFLTAIQTPLIMTVGGFSIMEGIMTSGIYLAISGLIVRFQEPMQKLMNFSTALQTTEMQMQRLNDVLRYQTDSLNYPQDGEKKTAFAKDRLSGRLTLKDVSFGYSPLDAPLISHFDLELKPGRWAAVVGASGSGKSTLAKIVTGLHEEWSGDVMFDGVKRREIPRTVIVNSLATVDQDVFQITGSVQENISLFDSSIRRADIIQAARDACIEDDILHLPGGYDAQVAEGGINFSGGQRQRLEIARALATNPSILILDEATSAIDPMTEQKILENIRRRGATCLIVAHRLSTIRDADEIIFLDHGKVAERGTHRELIQRDGPYRRLVEEREQEDNASESLD